jgi:transposase-like protein
MARKCTVCVHAERKNIDKSLVEPGSSLRDIARQYRVSKDALSRHVKGGHIEDEIKRVAAAHEAVETEDFLTYLQKRRARFEEMAEELRHHKCAPYPELKVYQIESKFAEMEGKVRGSFKEDKPREKPPITINLDVPEEVRKVAHLLPDVTV